MNPARYMCTSSCQRLSLNSAVSGSTSTTSPFSTRKPVGLFIHPLTEITKNEPGQPGQNDRNADSEMHAFGQPVPPVDVDRDEDRLHEEGEPLESEREPEHVTEGGHELGPQEPHLERQDRAGDDPDREDDQHRLRPPLGERLVERIAGAQPQALEEHHHRREGDAEAHQRDVDHERHGLHLTRLEQVLLLDRPAKCSVDHCSASIRAITAFTSERCVKACGKFPRWRPLTASISSA